MSAIAQNLADVRARIARAAERSGRKAEDVTLIAVSKTVPIEAIREAYAAGARQFGENYVQELKSKAEALMDLPELEWHFIGHLQRNKVRDAAHARLIHTVDSVRLVEAIAARARPGGQRVLVQVNLAGETQKSGASPADVPSILRAIEQSADKVHALGLMTMPPLDASITDARPIFRALRALRDQLGGALPHLSMGMSHDFEAAIEEGATMVRVGTAIFGSRPTA